MHVVRVEPGGGGLQGRPERAAEASTQRPLSTRQRHHAHIAGLCDGELDVVDPPDRQAVDVK
jgi:hypothetical protein